MHCLHIAKHNCLIGSQIIIGIRINILKRNFLIDCIRNCKFSLRIVVIESQISRTSNASSVCTERRSFLYRMRINVLDEISLRREYMKNDFSTTDRIVREKKKRKKKGKRSTMNFSLCETQVLELLSNNPLILSLLCVPHANRKSILEIVFARPHATSQLNSIHWSARTGENYDHSYRRFITRTDFPPIRYENRKSTLDKIV